MNDVLPKPFTKEGLLNMLEKHLGHLKKPDQYAMVPPPPVGMPHGPAGHGSIKDEASPGQSPSNMSQWNSPTNFTGISPAGSGAPYQMGQAPPYGIDQGSMQYASPTTPIGPGPPGPRQVPTHRRQVSDMTGGSVDDIGNEPKRPRIYATTNAAMNQMRRP
jgi:osomolarity two-component system response regulator SKN7